MQKIAFKPKTASAAGEVAKSHFTLLRAMHDNFTDSVSILDNQGKPLKDLKTPKTVDAYLRHFQMHFVKENPNTNIKRTVLTDWTWHDKRQRTGETKRYGLKHSIKGHVKMEGVVF